MEQALELFVTKTPLLDHVSDYVPGFLAYDKLTKKRAKDFTKENELAEDFKVIGQFYSSPAKIINAVNEFVAAKNLPRVKIALFLDLVDALNGFNLANGAMYESERLNQSRETILDWLTAGNYMDFNSYWLGADIDYEDVTPIHNGLIKDELTEKQSKQLLKFLKSLDWKQVGRVFNILKDGTYIKSTSFTSVDGHELTGNFQKVTKKLK